MHAWHEDCIYYDLADEKWNSIRIAKKGWKIIHDPPPLFRRFPHQQAQIQPQKDGNIDEFFNYVNIKNQQDQLLVKAYIIATLVPDIPHPILLVTGPQGCGKSDLMRMLRQLVDPSTVLLQSLRHNQLEMAIKLFHHYLVYSDNLTTIKQWLSDMLCRACTGEGFTKRRLYTDEESVIFQFRRCVGINGIALAELSPDLLDRCLTATLKQIPSEERRGEEELWSEFRKAKPKIFGAILTTLSKALDIHQKIKVDRLPRMADFARWGEAISQALGHLPGEFMKAYMENIGRQHQTVLEENPVGLALLKLMEQIAEYGGSPSQLLSKLEEIAEQNSIDTKAKMWPRSAVWVTRRIKKIETNLESQGIAIDLGRTGANRVITLRRNQNWHLSNSNDSINGNDSIFSIKKMTNSHDNHPENECISHLDYRKNTVNTVIPSEPFTKLVRLTTLAEGRCTRCGFQGRMDWQATMPDGSLHLLCEKCGFELAKKM